MRERIFSSAWRRSHIKGTRRWARIGLRSHDCTAAYDASCVPTGVSQNAAEAGVRSSQPIPTAVSGPIERSD